MIKVKNIDWECDTNVCANLPKELIMDAVEEDDIADMLSDKYGYLVKSFKLEKVALVKAVVTCMATYTTETYVPVDIAGDTKKIAEYLNTPEVLNQLPANDLEWLGDLDNGESVTEEDILSVEFPDMEFEVFNSVENIPSSLLLDSGTEICSLKGNGYDLRIEVKGEVRVTYKGVTYRTPSEFPEELKKIIRENPFDIEANGDVYIGNENWFEMFVIGHENEYFDTVDIENLTDEQLKAVCVDCLPEVGEL